MQNCENEEKTTTTTKNNVKFNEDDIYVRWNMLWCIKTK